MLESMAVTWIGPLSSQRTGGRKRLAPVVLAVLAILSAACQQGGIGVGGAALDRTTITFALSVQPDEASAITALVRRFERESKGGVSVNLVARFRDRPQTVNLASVSSSDMARAIREHKPRIHLFALDNVAVADLVERGLVQDLSHIPLDQGINASLIPEKFNGKRFFLPFRPNVRLTYASRAPLEEAGLEAPRTLQALRQVAQKLRDAHPGRRPVLTLSLSDRDDGRPAAVTIAELVLAFGGDPVHLNSEEAVKAFEYLRSLQNDGLLTRESLFAKHDTEIDYLKNGISWIAQNWSVTSAELARAGQLEDFLVYPGWQGTGKHVVGGDVLGIPVDVSGKELAAAIELASFLMSREAQRFLVDRNRWPAIRDDAYSSDSARDDTIRAVKEALERGWYRPAEPYWEAVTKAMNEAVERILRQGHPVRPVLDELHARVKDSEPDYPG